MVSVRWNPFYVFTGNSPNTSKNQLFRRTQFLFPVMDLQLALSDS